MDFENERVLFDFIRHIKDIDDSQKKSEAIRSVKSFFKTYSADISPLADFEDIPTFPHRYYGIFISQGARIGENCVIYQQVTIGSNLLIDSASMGYPQIGRNCYIGAGAKIVGNCNIGDNVRIGANAVVYGDVPSNCVVTGTEMSIKSRGKVLDNRYFSYDPVKGWAYKSNGLWHRDLSESEIKILNELRQS